MKCLFTRALYKISSRDLYQRSLCKISFARPPGISARLYEGSRHQLSTRSLDKTSMRDLYARSPAIPGHSKSPLFTRVLCNISSQDLYHRSSRHKTSVSLYTRFPHIFGPPGKLHERSLHRSSLQDIFPRPRSKILMQDLFTRMSLYLLARPLSDISTRPL